MINIPMSFTIPDAVKNSGLSRTAIYDALKRGQIAAVKRGKRTLILSASLSSYLESLPRYKAGA